MRVIQAPQPIKLEDDEFSFFLAGSAGQYDWRSELVEPLSDNLPVCFLNPFRNPWPKMVKELKEQFAWEAQGLQQASSIIFWFSDETVAPITLLEMGLSLDGNKPIFVGMNPNYKLNFDVSERIKLFRPNIPIWHSINELRSQILAYSKSLDIDMTKVVARRCRKKMRK